MITLPTILATATLLVLAMRAGGWPSQLDLCLMLFAFLSAWLLWVPATLIGLAGEDFPRHYMITGGVSGHAQALINPCVTRRLSKRRPLPVCPRPREVQAGAARELRRVRGALQVHLRLQAYFLKKRRNFGQHYLANGCPHAQMEARYLIRTLHKRLPVRVFFRKNVEVARSQNSPIKRVFFRCARR
ncbi:hypothetical protein OAO87_01925 [bacterium]|nr:hypothetical protein [bacterium]